MTTEEISISAYRNEMPKQNDLTVPEWLLFYRLRDVYREAGMNKELGANRKAVAIRQFELDRDDWVQAKEVQMTLAQFWKDIEPPARRYALDQNAQTAAAFFEAVYKVPLKTQKEQWERSETV